MNSCFLASRSVVVRTWKRNWRKFLPTLNPHLGFSLLFSYKVVSDSLWGHGLQHARLPCPSLFPGICAYSSSLSQRCHPMILFSVNNLLLLPSIFPRIRIFSNESALWIRWPKYWSFSISPSNEYSGLISFGVFDVFDLFAVQRTLKNLLQHHNSKASVLQYSVFRVQLSHPYVTTGNVIALTYGLLLVKWCFCFYTLFGFVIAFFQEASIF